jgi:hypothetical protein
MSDLIGGLDCYRHALALLDRAAAEVLAGKPEYAQVAVGAAQAYATLAVAAATAEQTQQIEKGQTLYLGGAT